MPFFAVCVCVCKFDFLKPLLTDRYDPGLRLGDREAQILFLV